MVDFFFSNLITTVYKKNEISFIFTLQLWNIRNKITQELNLGTFTRTKKKKEEGKSEFWESTYKFPQSYNKPQGHPFEDIRGYFRTEGQFQHHSMISTVDLNMENVDCK